MLTTLPAEAGWLASLGWCTRLKAAAPQQHVYMDKSTELPLLLCSTSGLQTCTHGTVLTVKTSGSYICSDGQEQAQSCLTTAAMV